MTTIGHENVGRLDVTVDNSLAVRGVERIGNFNGQGKQAIEFHRPCADQMLQRLAAEAFHHDEHMSFVLADFVDGADVGMIQRRCGTSLASKTFKGLGIGGRIIGEKLERDETSQLGVFGFINHAHATAAQEFNDAVVRDGLADHGKRLPARSTAVSPDRLILGRISTGVNLDCGGTSRTSASIRHFNQQSEPRQHPATGRKPPNPRRDTT